MISDLGGKGFLPSNKPVDRFYSLDVLRGIAALSVVFFHWQLFFGSDSDRYILANLPFSDWIFILYRKGWLAVDLFFCISGFVFYWLYSRKISENAFPVGKFVMLRFSRLYPLHFATLLLVVAYHLVMQQAYDGYVIPEHDDLKHFMLNIFLISSWGFEDGYSFNAPAWSISVEMLLYTVFFIICRLFGVHLSMLVAITAASFLIVQAFDLPVARGLSSFFLGGCVYLTYQFIINLRQAELAIRGVVGIGVAVWLVTLTFIYLKIDLSQAVFEFLPIPDGFIHVLDWILQRLQNAWPIMILFPLTILSLALFETYVGSFGKRVSFIGDISYSSYMLHFPAIMIISGIVRWLTIDYSIYYSHWFMLGFFTALLSISVLSYRYFEMPMQEYLRGKRNK